MDRWSIIRIKYCHSWNLVSDTMKTCMALNNIQDHSNIVQKYIFNKNQDDWDEFISSKQQWLDGKQYFAIENQVNIVTLFDLLV